MLDLPQNVIYQSRDACSVHSLIAGITLNVLEQSTEKSKSVLAIRALVHVVIIPVICVVFTPIALVGNAIESVAVDTTFARSRFQMDHHGRNGSKHTTTPMAFYVARSIGFFRASPDKTHQHHIEHRHAPNARSLDETQELKKSVTLVHASFHIPDTNCFYSQSISDIVNSSDVLPPCAIAIEQRNLLLPSNPHTGNGRRTCGGGVVRD